MSRTQVGRAVPPAYNSNIDTRGPLFSAARGSSPSTTSAAAPTETPQRQQWRVENAELFRDGLSMINDDPRYSDVRADIASGALGPTTLLVSRQRGVDGVVSITADGLRVGSRNAQTQPEAWATNQVADFLGDMVATQGLESIRAELDRLSKGSSARIHFFGQGAWWRNGMAMVGLGGLAL